MVDPREKVSNLPKRENLRLVRNGLGILAVAALLLITDHFTAPTHPVVGRDRSQTVIGHVLLGAGAQFQTYRLQQEKTNQLIEWVNRLIHVSTRVWQSGDVWGYIKDLANELQFSPHPEGTRFSHEFQKLNNPNLMIPEWLNRQEELVHFAQFTDSRKQRFEVVSFLLKKDTTFAALFAPRDLGFLTAPTHFTAWPDKQSRNNNTLAIGSDTQRAHANGAGFRVELGNNLHIAVGAGWHDLSPLFPFPNTHPGSSLRYGLVVPNDYAAPGTGLFEWKNGKRQELHPFAGDIHNAEYPPIALLLHDGTMTVLKGKEIIPYAEGTAPATDGVLVQIAYSINHAKEIPLLNQLLSEVGIENVNPTVSNQGEKTASLLLDSFAEGLPEKLLPSLSVIWTTIVKTQAADGTVHTYLAYTVNHSTESQHTSARFKTTAAMTEIIQRIQQNQTKTGKKERIFDASTSHLGAQGSTANVIFTNGLPPNNHPEMPRYESAE